MKSPFGVDHAYSGQPDPVVSKALFSTGSLKAAKKATTGSSQFKRGAYGGGKAPAFGKKRKAAFNLGRNESRNV